MGNWFEDNQTKSIITYTIFIAGITWAIYRFTFEEQKIDFYKAQVESSKTELEQHKARIDFLEKENDKLEVILKEFQDWNFKSKDPTLFYKTKYEEIANNKTKLDSMFFKQGSNVLDSSNVSPHKVFKSLDIELFKGKSYINDAEKLIIGLNDVSVGGTCNFTVSAGEKDNQTFKDVKVGSSYKFGNLKITLSETSYIASQAQFHISKQ